ncbi:MAG: Mu transposase C-terminal domain-containing protein [Phycisphaerales bacterium]|nr:Mu transposase C-terminal domain-containing protein [Phycisphaerales bacterium]
MNITYETEKTNPPATLIAGLAWISVGEAAKRMGVTEQRVRALCASEWKGRELAKLETPSTGGKAVWVIREDAHPGLARIKFPDQMRVNLRHLTDSQRDEHGERMAIYRQWQEACRAAIRAGSTNEKATEHFVLRMRVEGKNIHPATLHRWHKVYRKTGGLLDRRWESRVSESTSPMLAEIRRLWLSQSKLKALACWRMAEAKAKEQGWEICSYRTAARYLQTIPAGERIYKREGPDAFEAKAAPSLARDYSTIDSNEMWNADHHVFDILVQVGQKIDKATGEVKPIYARPWLTAWQDMRSRKIVGWIIRAEDPNTDSILDALRRAIESHGVPVTAYTDNGKDFDSQTFTGETKAMRWKRRLVKVEHDQERLGSIYGNLDIGHIHAWPYHGMSKPIERFFGTLEDQFGRLWDTYCGRNPQERPERLGDMLARGKAPKLADFVAAFDDWLENSYHGQIHTGDSMNCTPNGAWAANLSTKRTVTADLLELLMQRRIGPVKVGKNGVSYKGLRFGQFQLGQLLHQKVFIRVDDRDLSKVSVWMLEGKFVCEARINGRLSVKADHGDLRRGIAEKKHHSKILKGAHEAKLRIAEDLVDRVNRAAVARAEAAQQRPQPRPEPPFHSIRPIRSDLESQLEAVEAGRQSLPLRRAVGAELMSLEDQEKIYAREEL